MTSRPILFSAPMVRALLAGRKTQTRRAIKPQPQPNGGRRLTKLAPYLCEDGRWNWVLAATGHGTGDPFLCPYGAPGDELWVRETWAQGLVACVYHADGTKVQRWQPSIHMPRWASRITLRIEEVRIERLQDISEADAIAEGAPAVSLHDLDGASIAPSRRYRELWESINGAGSWRENPWVWAITFERLKTTAQRVY